MTLPGPTKVNIAFPNLTAQQAQPRQSLQGRSSPHTPALTAATFPSHAPGVSSPLLDTVKVQVPHLPRLTRLSDLQPVSYLCNCPASMGWFTRAKYSPAPSFVQTWLGVFAQNPVRGCCFCLPGSGLSQVPAHVKDPNLHSKQRTETRRRGSAESPEAAWPGEKSATYGLLTPVWATGRSIAQPLFLLWKRNNKVGFPRWLSGKESACQCRRLRRHGFEPWVRKIPWKRNKNT